MSKSRKPCFSAHLCCNGGALAAIFAEAHGDKRAHSGCIRLDLLRLGLRLRGCIGGRLCWLLHDKRGLPEHMSE